MRKLVERFRKRQGTARNGTAALEPFDIEPEIRTIQHVETTEDIGLGKRIHHFRYQELDLRLDRDILGLYRVTVNEGKERLYSFTIVCQHGDYDALRLGYQEIAHFLAGDRRLANLPRHERLKGHYYGP